MAYSGSGFTPGGSVFGGYTGGYTQTPAGVILPSNINSLGAAYPPTLGANLPSIDPNNYLGPIHFGPSTAIIGAPSAQFPIIPGYIDPNLGIIGTANYNAGI